MATTTRDIFALPGELSRAILASVETNGRNACGRNAVLNRMALAGRSWHNALAPPAGACMAALTRRVTLGERDMLAVAQIVRPWWRWVKGQQDVTDVGLASLAAGCSAIITLNLWGCIRITGTGLASLAAGCSAITNLDLTNCHQITDTGLTSLVAGCSAITSLNLSFCRRITDTRLASLAAGCSAISPL